MSEKEFESIDRLRNEDNLADAMHKAEAQVATFSSDHYSYLRKLSKQNLFFLASNILGYNRLSENYHGDFCRWKAQTDATYRFRLSLQPRSHYKSTIDTISDSIRCALPDDDNNAPWPECLGTGIRIMIGHETAEMASRFLTAIAGHFLSNPMLMGLFPECIPTPKKHIINSFQLELPRKRHYPEPTFDTMGVGAKSQGRHYNKLKLDDLIGDKARDSKKEMETAIEWFDNIQAFFDNFLQDEFDLTGTRWAFDDLYSHVMKRYGPALAVYKRSAIEKRLVDGVMKEVPAFPEAFTLESFEIIKKNSKIWSTQYANDPELIDSAFLPQWLRYYNRRGPFDIVTFNKNEFGIIAIKQLNIYKDLDRVILIDPALNGNAGIIVTGTSVEDDIYTLEVIKGVFRPPELIEKIFQLVSKYQPRLVAIEEVLFSETYRHWLNMEMPRRGIRFLVHPVKTKGVRKEARIQGLATYYAKGKLYHNQDQTELLDEFRTLGASIENKHLLDALAYGPEVWARPYFQLLQAQTTSDIPQDLRSAITGY